MWFKCGGALLTKTENSKNWYEIQLVILQRNKYSMLSLCFRLKYKKM
jgi:hypothetical protein